MNKREDAILLRLYSILHDVPGANLGGSIQSASVQGVVTFAKDMMALKEPLTSVLHFVRVGEYQEAEETLSSIEAWVAMRKGRNWQDVYPFPFVKISHDFTHLSE